MTIGRWILPSKHGVKDRRSSLFDTLPRSSGRHAYHISDRLGRCRDLREGRDQEVKTLEHVHLDLGSVNVVEAGEEEIMLFEELPEVIEKVGSEE